MISKAELRKEMSVLKKQYSVEVLGSMSISILAQLEKNISFKEAKTVMLYYSLKDEVRTHKFIEKWSKEKRILLPVVDGDDIKVKEYTGGKQMVEGLLRVMEPDTDNFVEKLDDIDLIIVPGVAFDKNKNRMGRGKGYYDRFLSDKNIYKIGICFPFQVVKIVPSDERDIVMDEIITLPNWL